MIEMSQCWCQCCFSHTLDNSRGWKCVSWSVEKGRWKGRHCKWTLGVQICLECVVDTRLFSPWQAQTVMRRVMRSLDAREQTFEAFVVCEHS